MSVRNCTSFTLSSCLMMSVYSCPRPELASVYNAWRGWRFFRLERFRAARPKVTTWSTSSISASSCLSTRLSS